jgi:hypothetical protein
MGIRKAATAMWMLLLVPATALAEAPSVPDMPLSPAFTALDMNPTVVTRPTSAASFATAVLAGVDTEGRLVPGLAVDLAPAWLVLGSGTTLEDWRSSYGLQAASRLTVSLGTAALPGSATGSAIAGAIRWVAVDEADPRFDADLARCVHKALAETPPDPIPGSTDVDVEHAGKDTIDVVGRCKEEARNRRGEKGWGVAVATAVTGQTASGSWKDMAFGTVDVWTDVRYGLSVHSAWTLAFALAVRYRYSRPLGTSSGDLAFELRSEGPRFRIAGAVAWKPTQLDRIGDTAGSLAAGGKVEVRVYDDLWVSAQVDYQGGADSPCTGTFGVAGLSYTVN